MVFLFNHDQFMVVCIDVAVERFIASVVYLIYPHIPVADVYFFHDHPSSLVS